MPDYILSDSSKGFEKSGKKAHMRSSASCWRSSFRPLKGVSIRITREFG
jgi:hypothetical protein